MQAPTRTGAPVRPLIDAEPALPDVVAEARSRAPDSWQPAAKRITTDADVQYALRSNTLRRFVAFTIDLSSSVQGKKLTDACHESDAVQRVCEVLDALQRMCKETPPVAHSVRYGNPAFRDWYQKMTDAAPELIYDLLGDEVGAATTELIPYFLDSFGNRSRIDYGTGHETTFICFLYCLYALGVLKPEDRQATVLRIFHRYVQLMRELQTSYWLEPAGSHGVWGLDEYHFFPFIWGAAQLVDHPVVKPGGILDDDLLSDYANDYMYLDAVQFVRQVKKGPLHETSPMLYDISVVPNWFKVNQGLFKMYQVEVLSKRPIMQHFLFGSLLPFPT